MACTGLNEIETQAYACQQGHGGARFFAKSSAGKKKKKEMNSQKGIQRTVLL